MKKAGLGRGAFTGGRAFSVMCCVAGILLVCAGIAEAAGDGQVRRARLGVGTTDMSAGMQKMIGRDYKLGGDAGVIVAQVAKGSAAEKAGIRKNDVIVRIGSTLITSGRQLARTIGSLRPGQTVQVTLLREVTVIKTNATLGAVGSDEAPPGPDRSGGRETDPTAALFNAAARGDADKVASLIRSGADVRAPNAQGQVALHAASAGGHVAAAKLLIDADNARAKKELAGTVIPDFDAYLRRINPTLSVRDAAGETALHAAAKNGKAAMAKLLVEKGADRKAKNAAGQTPGQVAARQRFEDITRLLGGGGGIVEPFDDAPRVVTRYAPKLRTLLAQVRDIERRFAQAGSSRAPQAQVQALGAELLTIGSELDRLFNVSSRELTRFGTIEEVDLLEAIRKSHEQAANELKAQAVAQLASNKSGSTSRDQKRRLLLGVGRQLIEREAVRWMRQNGFEELLVEEGQAAFGGKVRQGIELNLRTFLDKKSVELLGMPLGGFRSAKAAFRLQARRKIREVVAGLVVNFSGNQLVVRFVQRHVVQWVEKDLWPKLREGFRPKTRLDRRVRISTGTMRDAQERLNNLVKGRRPTNLPLAPVIEALNRAEGAIYAARYLERDLKRAGNQELINELVAAERLLRRDIRRIRHQFLMADIERMEEIGDHLEFTLGVHDDVGKRLRAMAEERRRIEAALRHIMRTAVNENVAGVMAIIHEESPWHSPEVAGRLRDHFARNTVTSDGFVITEIVKQSQTDAKVAIVEKVGSFTHPISLAMRRSGRTWKLYGPGDNP